jgi:hypothetical protein
LTAATLRRTVREVWPAQCRGEKTMELDRRGFVLGLTGLFVAGQGARAAVRGPVPPGGYDLADPADALQAMLRMQSRLDGRDAPWWYFGRIYAVLPGQAPLPLFRYEGLEIIRMTPAGNGEYAATGATTSFFQDWKTGQVMETFANPVSGRTNQVTPNLIGGKPGSAAAFYSAKGVRPGRVAPADWQPDGLELMWTQHGDAVWVSHDRTYPPGLPQPMGEASCARARVAELHDRARAFVPASFSSTYLAPYPAWMEMQGQPGHVMWHADGLKLESIDALPADFRARVEKLFPERLAAPPFST